MLTMGAVGGAGLHSENDFPGAFQPMGHGGDIDEGSVVAGGFYVVEGGSWNVGAERELIQGQFAEPHLQVYRHCSPVIFHQGAILAQIPSGAPDK